MRPIPCRLKGHADADASGWPPLVTVSDLTHILTTIAWTTSAHHAAVNFGQVSLVQKIVHCQHNAEVSASASEYIRIQFFWAS